MYLGRMYRGDIDSFLAPNRANKKMLKHLDKALIIYYN